MIFIIDRIDEGIAICETANGNGFPVPAALLGDVKEGDCIDVCPEGNIRITAIDDGYMTVASEDIYAALPLSLYEDAVVGSSISFVRDEAEHSRRMGAIQALADELFE